MERRLGIAKRFSLEKVAAGWNDKCYVDLKPATVGDLEQYAQLDTDSLKEIDAIKIMYGFVKDHVIQGKIMLFNETGGLVLNELVLEDINSLPPQIIVEMFAEISGASIDPKDTQKATKNLKIGENLASNEEHSTEMQSSMN